MSDQTMTPAKWGIVAVTILALIIAIGVVYQFTKSPVPQRESLGISKDDLMKQVTGSEGSRPSTSSSGEPEVKSMKNRSAVPPESSNP